VILVVVVVFSMTRRINFGVDGRISGKARRGYEIIGRNTPGTLISTSNFQTHLLNSKFNIMILQTLWRYHIHSVSETDQMV
jgi:hypothetical protein